MNIIVGKITEDSKDRAYMLFSVKEQKRRIMTREAVREALIKGEKILGFELNCNTYGRYNLRKSKSYIWKNMPELNGKGQPETDADGAVEIFIGTNGFKEVKVYVTVNSNGDIRIYSRDNFISRIEKAGDTVIGAGLQDTEDSKELNLYIKNMLTDTWMEQLGFKRDEDFNWTK